MRVGLVAYASGDLLDVVEGSRKGVVEEAALRDCAWLGGVATGMRPRVLVRRGCAYGLGYR